MAEKNVKPPDLMSLQLPWQQVCELEERLRHREEALFFRLGSLAAEREDVLMRSQEKARQTEMENRTVPPGLVLARDLLSPAALSDLVTATAKDLQPAIRSRHDALRIRDKACDALAVVLAVLEQRLNVATRHLPEALPDDEEDALQDEPPSDVQLEQLLKDLSEEAEIDSLPVVFPLSDDEEPTDEVAGADPTVESPVRDRSETSFESKFPARFVGVDDNRTKDNVAVVARVGGPEAAADRTGLLLPDIVIPKPGPSAAERRREPRRALYLHVTLDSDHNFYTGLVENISTGGLFVSTLQPLPVGTELNLHLSLPGGAVLHLHGRVSWIRPYDPNRQLTPGMGVAFLDLPDEALRHIERFLSHRDPIMHKS